MRPQLVHRENCGGARAGSGVKDSSDSFEANTLGQRTKYVLVISTRTNTMMIELRRVISFFFSGAIRLESGLGRCGDFQVHVDSTTSSQEPGKCD